MRLVEHDLDFEFIRDALSCESDMSWRIRNFDSPTNDVPSGQDSDVIQH